MTRFALAIALASAVSACAAEAAPPPRSTITGHSEGSRMQNPAVDTRGGGDMPGKGRAGEHKFAHVK